MAYDGGGGGLSGFSIITESFRHLSVEELGQIKNCMVLHHPDPGLRSGSLHV